MIQQITGCRLKLLCVFPTCAVLLLAADPSWKNKPVVNWTLEDARQILTDSPWARNVTAVLTRRLNEDELRENSGNMGQPHGIGIDGVGENQVRPKLDIPTILTQVYTAPPAESVQVLVRWETALPVRTAQLKVGEIAPPTLEGDGYRVAVYGIPGPLPKGDPQKLGAPFKQAAALTREGKKDVKPSRVEVFQREDGLVVVFLFPLSAEISTKDALVGFHAQIGRIVVRQTFDVHEMYFHGQLEL
jgi:hypothetical protein